MSTARQTTTLTKGEVFQHPVEMPLTDKELIAYADEYAALDAKKTEVEMRFEGQKGTYKGEVKKIEENQSMVLNRLRTKKEFKPIDCYQYFSHFEGIVETRRVDTDEVITSRTMTVEEFKADLPFPEAEKETDEADES